MKIYTHPLPIQNGSATNSLVMKLFPFIFIICSLSTPPLAAQTSWTGTTNTDWSTATNWTNGVPTDSIDAIIGDDHFTGPYHPNLTAPSFCRSLILGSASKSSSLTVDRTLVVSQDIMIGNVGTLTHALAIIFIQGNWYNKGSYNASGIHSFVTFNGSVQSIHGTSTFRNLTINKCSTTTLNGDISVIRTFSVKGKLNRGLNLVTLSGGII
jgi:fibronectin-binding autotransporter adhesin